MIMKKLLRNEQGLSLAELLATLAIASLIGVFIISVHLLVQKQYSSQSTEIQHLTDITIAAKAITKDIRSYEVIELNKTSIKFKNGNKYELENNVLKKNDADYLYEINNFDVKQVDNKILLKIKSTTGQKIETEIVIR